MVAAGGDVDRAVDVASDLCAGGAAAIGVRVDVADPASTRAMATATVDAFGGMEIDLLLTVDWDYYRRFMAVNMDGALLCIRACWEHMAAGCGFAIVSRSSTAARLHRRQR